MPAGVLILTRPVLVNAGMINQRFRKVSDDDCHVYQLLLRATHISEVSFLLSRTVYVRVLSQTGLFTLFAVTTRILGGSTIFARATMCCSDRSHV